MIRSQRVLVVLGLLTVAWLLHAMLCEWEYQRYATSAMPRILAYQHERTPTPARRGGRPRELYTGLFVQRGGSHGIAVVFGVITPLVLAGVNAYLLLGWRHAARVGRGLCPQCGYDLRGARDRQATRCPECGWQRQGVDRDASTTSQLIASRPSWPHWSRGDADEEADVAHSSARRS